MNWSRPTDCGSTENARLENRKLFKILFKLLYLRFPPLQMRTCVFRTCVFSRPYSTAVDRRQLSGVFTRATSRWRGIATALCLSVCLSYKSSSIANVSLEAFFDLSYAPLCRNSGTGKNKGTSASRPRHVDRRRRCQLNPTKVDG